jgi:hypothetical protein
MLYRYLPTPSRDACGPSSLVIAMLIVIVHQRCWVSACGCFLHNSEFCIFRQACC